MRKHKSIVHRFWFWPLQDLRKTAWYKIIYSQKIVNKFIENNPSVPFILHSSASSLCPDPASQIRPPQWRCCSPSTPSSPCPSWTCRSLGRWSARRARSSGSWRGWRRAGDRSRRRRKACHPHAPLGPCGPSSISELTKPCPFSPRNPPHSNSNVQLKLFVCRELGTNADHLRHWLKMLAGVNETK